MYENGASRPQAATEHVTVLLNSLLCLPRILCTAFCSSPLYSPKGSIKVSWQTYIIGAIFSGNLEKNTHTQREIHKEGINTLFWNSWRVLQYVHHSNVRVKMCTCFHRKIFSALLLIETKSPCLCLQKCRASSANIVLSLMKYWFPPHSSHPSAVVLKSAHVVKAQCRVISGSYISNLQPPIRCGHQHFVVLSHWLWECAWLCVDLPVAVLFGGGFGVTPGSPQATGRC